MNSPAMLEIDEFKRKMLKSLLDQCNKNQKNIFNLMYSPKNVDKPIYDVVDEMPEDKLNWAIQQCEKTIKNNKI